MVSCEIDGDYQADIVRIVCADNLSSSEMFKEEEIQTSSSGRYTGRSQATNPGSYVEIAPNAVLDRLTSFTVQAMVCPMLLAEGPRVRPGAVPLPCEAPTFDDQHLISRWDSQTQRGWALLLDRKGRPMFIVGTGGMIHRVLLDRALLQDRWFLVMGGVDAQQNKLQIAACSAGHSPGELVAWPERRQVQHYASGDAIAQAGILRFAACTAGMGNGARLKPAYCFNGRLDRVRLIEGVVTLEEARKLAGTAIPLAMSSRVIGFWDFAKGIDKIDITDLSSNALHGVTVNVPTRAVSGVDWDGSFHDWRDRPDHYSAIHFHDDDLYDSEWEKDFSYVIPKELPSGVYAARLRKDGCEDYIPFFVAPPKGQAHAAAAVLLPTLSYTAYTNVTALTTFTRKRESTDAAGTTMRIEEDWHACVLQSAANASFVLKHYKQLGKGIYFTHPDGTLFSNGSQRHPNMTIKPKGVTWQLVADTYLTDWLEQKSIPYDVITDDLLHEEGVDLLKSYAVVLTGSHPEYYTQRMLDAVDHYQRQGGRWMYLGGNGFYWVTSLHSQLPGVIEVRKDSKNYAGHFPRHEVCHAFDGRPGGYWEDNGRASQLLFGVGPSGYNDYDVWQHGAPYKRLADSYTPRAAFIFEGVSHEIIGDHGIFGAGAGGQEVDEINQQRGTPAHALHLGRADAFGQGEFSTDGPIADLVFFETPNGGAVFSVGSISWVGALSHNRYENDVSRVTENVLRRFLDKRPFLLDGLPDTVQQCRSPSDS